MIKIDNNWYRIMDIKGTVSSRPQQIWKMTISAEHVGPFAEEVDTSELHYN
jgi:hypothetical protein